MTVTYLSNVLNHHLFFIAQEFYKLLGDDFCFIETVENLNKGFDKGFAFMFADGENTDMPWLLKAYENEDLKRKCQKKIDESDVVITANASDDLIKKRLSQNKLTFRAHERWYRTPLPFYKYPKAVLGAWLHHGRYKSLYMLCASAYTAQDVGKVKCFKNKTFKWGYFPEFKCYKENELVSLKEKSIPLILWSGRFIDCKRVQDVIEACAELKHEGLSFELAFAGCGPGEDEAKKLVKKSGLDCCTEFYGLLNPKELRALMEKSDIYLFTSDFNEGWGAVLNEAMNSGCAVVVSHAVGAAPFLIENKKNGIIYKMGDVRALGDAIKVLLSDKKQRCELGLNAYKTISEFWNPEYAAKSFLDLSQKILNGEKLPDNDFDIQKPCTRAPVIKNNWFTK